MSPFPFTVERLAGSLRELIPGYPDAALCVAVSGGVDSVALLHAAARLASGAPSLCLRALHVDHGLQAASGEWAGACGTLCAALGVPLEVLRLELAPAPGASVESEARAARYDALAGALQAGELLLTAHHADDQLETVLLQLLRGAGVRGLAAMPRAAPLGAGSHLRPLLDVERRALEAYAHDAGLSWVEDPMNIEARFDRAFLRQKVLPVLRGRWPAAATTVGRTARHLAQAQELLDALAAKDADGRLEGGRLEIAALSGLSRPRQVNLLRWWIASRGLGMPSAARLEAILDDLVPARRDAQPLVSWPDGEVRRYRGRLYGMRPLGPPPPAGWHGCVVPTETIELPCGLGSLALEPATGQGIATDALSGRLEVSFRSGGESLRPAGRDSARALANLFQEAGVVPWMRSRVPLLRDTGRVVAVAGLWIAEGYAARDGQPGAVPRWRRGPPIN